MTELREAPTREALRVQGREGARRFAGLRELLGSEGSTRSVGLLRIGVVLLLWARWGEGLMLAETPSVGLSLVFFGATGLLLVGLWTRFAAVATAVVMLVVYLWFGVHLRRVEWIHHHHYLLVSASCVLALTPCGRSFSLDRWRSGSPEHGPLWALRLFTIQLAAVYLWSAVDKMSPAFLNGARLEQIAMAEYFGSDPPDWHALAVVMAWGVMLIELALGLGFLLGRTPRWLLIAGVGLHAAIYLIVPVATFSATMVCLYIAAIDPAVVHRAIDRLTRG